MESLVIHARSLESAQGFLATLLEFRADLVEENGRYRVEVPLTGSDHTIAPVLDALQVYVSERGDGPARLNLGEHEYTLHPTDPAPG